MKKDIFNGYVLESAKRYVKGQLIAVPICLLIVASFCAILAVIYGEQMQFSMKCFLYVISAAGALYGILYPLLTLLCIRNYPKCKKIMFLFINGNGIFKDEED